MPFKIVIQFINLKNLHILGWMDNFSMIEYLSIKPLNSDTSLIPCGDQIASDFSHLIFEIFITLSTFHIFAQ